MEKDTQINTWIKPGIFNALQKISIPLFGVLTTMLLAHKALTKTEMGVWANFLAITTFIDMFRGGLIRASLVKYINFSEKEKHHQIISSAFILNFFISLLLVITLITTSSFIEGFLRSPGLGQALNIYAFTIFILVFFSHLEWLMYAFISFKSLFYTYFVRQGITFAGILLYYLIVGKASINALVFIYSGGILVGTVIAFFYMRHVLELRLSVSRYWIKELWRFGKFVFGSNVSTLIFKNADQFLLSNITANPALVASQNISIRVTNIADIPSQVTGDFLFPKNSRQEFAENRALTKYYYEKAVGASLSVIFPIMIVMLVFPKLLILVLAGREYFDAVPYLRLISLSIFTQAYLKQFGVIMDSGGFPHINFRIVTTIALSMIGFCYLFIPGFELMGAAYALLATHLVGFALSMVVLYKYFGISVWNTLKYCFAFYPELASVMKQYLKKADVKAEPQAKQVN